MFSKYRLRMAVNNFEIGTTIKNFNNSIKSLNTARNSEHKKTRNQYLIPGLLKNFGGVLLSHTAARAVPSALKSLTAVFGMGTGVTSSLLPPKNDNSVFIRSV